MTCSECGSENANHLCQICRMLFCRAGGCPLNEGQHHPTVEIEALVNQFEQPDQNEPPRSNQ